MKEMSDHIAFLTGKIKDMSKELHSSNAYIDALYADLNANQTPNTKMKADLEKRELVWLESEIRYTKRIEELEQQLKEGKSKVSMDMYLSVIKNARQIKMEVAKKQETIEKLTSTVGGLRDQLEKMQSTSSKRSSAEKSVASRLRMRHVTPTAASEQNDENAAPPKKQRDEEHLGGKRLNHTRVRSVGGRRALSDQVRRARRFGDKPMQNTVETNVYRI